MSEQEIHSDSRGRFLELDLLPPYTARCQNVNRHVRFRLHVPILTDLDSGRNSIWRIHALVHGSSSATTPKAACYGPHRAGIASCPMSLTASHSDAPTPPIMLMFFSAYLSSKDWKPCPSAVQPGVSACQVNFENIVFDVRNHVGCPSSPSGRTKSRSSFLSP